MPGPGSHNVPALFEHSQHPSSHVPATPAFSMSAGWREGTPRKDKVGPGMYFSNSSMDAVKRRTPGLRFATQKRLLSEPHKTNVTAAPDLAQQDNSNYKRSPRYGFGCTQRKLPHEKKAERGRSEPGPSDTHHEDRMSSKWTAGPNFSILTPRARKEPENPVPEILPGPGPGAYPIDCPGVHEAPSYKKTPYYKFSSSSRFPTKTKSKSGEPTPGPGAYVTVSSTRTGQNCFAEGAPKWSMPGRAELDVAAIGDPAVAFVTNHL